MTRNNRNFLLGVLFGFIGIGLYAMMLEGFENITIDDIFSAFKNLAAPFILTEICMAIGAEGVKNLKFEFRTFKEKHKKVSKKEEA